jgi:uncharacterized protein (TIGR02246 family)
MRYGVLGSAGVACLLAACSHGSRQADIKAIAKLEAQWVEDIKAKDLEKWVNHYAEDGSILLPNSPPVTGRDNIRASLKGRLKDPHWSLIWRPEKIETSERLGYVRGTYKITRTDRKTQEPITDQGKYVTIYRKEPDGSWKVIEDMASSDMPPPRPEPESNGSSH